MKLKITVHGVAYEVDVEVLDAGEGFPTTTPRPSPRVQNSVSAPVAAPQVKSSPSAKPSDGSVTSPIAGTIVEIKGKPGDNVTEGQILLIIEAMKMKTSIAAPTPGKIKAVPIAVGDNVREGQVLIEFE
jgi:biotin carboxyl carrier protein